MESGNKWAVGVYHAKKAELAGKQADSVEHEILIEDQSGSMTWAVKQVAEDLCEHVSNLARGTLVTVGYFSSAGDFRWWAIAYKLNSDEDYERLQKMIRDNAASRGMTCFSEILADLPKVIEGSKALADSVNLVFLTDGHPVVSNQEKERAAIFAAIEAVKKHLSKVLVVGYGEYYNRQLLSQMAAAFGGSLQHAGNITDFGKELGKIRLSRKGRRVTIDFGVNTEVAFSIDGAGVITVFEVKDGKASVPEGVDINFMARGAVGGRGLQEIDTAKAVAADYAAALVLNQRGDTAGALEVLSELGDIELVKTLGNALTNAEFGRAEQAIKDAVYNPKARLMGGYKVGCLPTADAFDLLDLLELLRADKDAFFYVGHPAWDYKRIGRGREVAGEYPPFIASKDAGIPFNKLTWSSTELNLSLLAEIQGKVRFPDAVRAGGFGFALEYPCRIFRNYALVANCYPNIEKLPVSFSEDTYVQLVRHGLIQYDKTNVVPYAFGQVYVLDLTKIPVCNRAKSQGDVTAAGVGVLQVTAELIAATIKVLKAKRNELDPDKEVGKDSPFSAEQEAFLWENGIKNGLYAPPVTALPATDVLPTRLFEIKVKGFSSLPKVADVTAKIAKGGKALTLSEQAISEGIDLVSQLPTQYSIEVQVQMLDDQLKKQNEMLNGLRTNINNIRFGLALGNRWFSDFASRAENTKDVVVGGKTYTVKFEVSQVDKQI